MRLEPPRMVFTFSIFSYNHLRIDYAYEMRTANTTRDDGLHQQRTTQRQRHPRRRQPFNRVFILFYSLAFIDDRDTKPRQRLP